MDFRTEHIVIETDRYRIEGELTLPSEGYRSRLSDYLNQRDREFLPVQNASVAELGGEDEPEAAGFVLVGRCHIRLVIPVEQKDWSPGGD